MPIALFLLPSCVTLTLIFQYAYGDTIHVAHPLRRWISQIPWHKWFPCQQLCFSGQRIITVHPHGILCCGAVAGIHLVPNSTTLLCVAPILFYVPIIGWILRLIGCIRATKEVMQRALVDGHTLLVVPGGVPEIVLAETGDDTRRFARHGFLKLMDNVPVTVVYVKGECSTYTMYQGPFLDQRVYLSWLLNIPLITPILIGWWGTWLPKRVPLTFYCKPLHIFTKEAYTKVFKELTLTRCRNSEDH